MSERNQIVMRTYPGAFSDADLQELVFVTNLLARKSQRFAELVGAWLDREIERRGNDAPIEPEMLGLGFADWTDGELSDAAVAAVIALITAADSSARVRTFLGQLALTTACWTTARLTGDRK